MRGKPISEGYRGTVNQNVKQLAEAAGLRPRKLDRLAGLKEGTTERVIAGKRKVYADELAPIAAALGASVERLFDGVAAGQ